MTLAVHQQLAQILAADPDPDQLNTCLRLLAKWRAKLLENTHVAKAGTTVTSGPFKGMNYAVSASEGGRIPRLLGCYETTLSPVIETIIAARPALLIDVGCAEGYYAVGFATRLPDAIIWARDESEAAQSACADLASANNVAGRVKIGGKLTHADFDICRAQPTTVICDIEGAEATLLDPDRAKGLQRANILVEVHEGLHPGLVDTLTDRFAASHDITRIDRSIKPDSLPDWAEDISDLDRLLMLWEWRSFPTPWLWMQSRFRY